MCPASYSCAGTVTYESTPATGEGEQIVMINGLYMRARVLGPAYFSAPPSPLTEDREVAQKAHMGTYWQQFNKGVYGGKRKKR
jgi:hypothetical protein